MGLDTIPSRLDGQGIDQTWFNVLRSVLNGDFCPRNSSGVATDQAGNLGSSTYRFLYAYLMTSVYYNGSRSVEVKAATGMSANYSIGLPSALPGANDKIVSADSSGNLQTSIAVDGSTLEVNSGTIRVKSGGITRSKLASLAPVLSSSSGNFGIGTTVNTFVDVTNLSVTVTSVAGRPIFVALISDGSANKSRLSQQSGSKNKVRFLRNTSSLAALFKWFNGDIPVSHCFTFDPQPAGTYTYKAQLLQDTSNGATVSYAKLIAFET